MSKNFLYLSGKELICLLKIGVYVDVVSAFPDVPCSLLYVFNLKSNPSVAAVGFVESKVILMFGFGPSH